MNIQNDFVVKIKLLAHWHYMAHHDAWSSKKRKLNKVSLMADNMACLFIIKPKKVKNKTFLQRLKFNRLIN
jgi:hypothetical protein